MVFLLGNLAPKNAHSSSDICEAQSKAAIQKKSLEMELAVMAGEVSDLEVAGMKERLLHQTSLDKKNVD